MTKCPVCGATVGEGERFCRECGTRLLEGGPATASAGADDRHAVMHRPGGGNPDPFAVGGSDDAAADDDFFSQFTPKAAIPEDAPLPSRRSRRRFNPRINDTGEVPASLPPTPPAPHPQAFQPPAQQSFQPPVESPVEAPTQSSGFEDADVPPTAAMSAEEIAEATRSSAPQQPPAGMPPLPLPVPPVAPPAPAASPAFSAQAEEPAAPETDGVSMPGWFTDLVDDGPVSEPIEIVEPTAEEPAPQPPQFQQPQFQEPEFEAPAAPAQPPAPAASGADSGDSATFTQLIRGLADDPADRPIESPAFDQTGLVPLPSAQQPPAAPAQQAPLPPAQQADTSAEIEAARARAAAFWGTAPAAQTAHEAEAAEAAEAQQPEFQRPAEPEPAREPDLEPVTFNEPEREEPAVDTVQSTLAGWFGDDADPDTAPAQQVRPAPAQPSQPSQQELPPLPTPAAFAQSSQPAASAPSGPAPFAAPAAGAGGGAGAPTPPVRGGGSGGRGGDDGDSVKQRRRGVTTILVAAAAAVLLIGGTFGAIALFGGGGNNDEPAADGTTAAAESPSEGTEGGEGGTTEGPATQEPDPTPTPEPFEPVTFQSQSGNIRCQITSEDGAVCQILERNFTTPDAACSGAIVGVNNEGITWPCVGGTLGTGAVLEYDVPVSAGEYTCSISYATGVTCQNGKGDSFSMEFDLGISTEGATAANPQIDVTPVG